jgi:hypothetical protein
MNQKLNNNDSLSFFGLLCTPKRLRYGHLLRQGSGSAPRRQDLTKKVRIQLVPDPQHCIQSSIIKGK